MTESLQKGWIPKLSQVYNQGSDQEPFDSELMKWPMDKALDSQLLGFEFKTTGWLQGRPSLSSFHGQ